MTAESVTIAYLGPAGTFAEAAVTEMGLSGVAAPAASVIAALDDVRSGKATAAVVPIENSVEGSVSGTLDELAADPPLRITAEVAVPVRFTLMRSKDFDGQIRAVGTHSHAAAQCRRWLHENLPDASIVFTGSTAGAAALLGKPQDLTETGPHFDAAIAPELAAHRYGLAVVADDIGDNRDALTRFVRLELPGPLPLPTGADRTSLALFMKANRAGALLEILTELAVRGINMTRLESRPTRHALGDYCFSVDIDGHINDARVGEALKGLRRACADVLFLGSYPKHDGNQPVLAEGVTDADYADADAWLATQRSNR